MKRKFIQVFAFMLAFILFISCPLSVYASEKWEGSLGLTLYYNKDKILKYIKDTGEFWLYGASQAGAIVQHDFVSFAENKKKMDDILDEGDKIGVYINDKDEAKGFFFSKEFMAQLKALLDNYAKEHEPYYMVNTLTLDDFKGNTSSGSKIMYDTVKNLLSDSSSGVIAFGADYMTPTHMFFADIGSDFKKISPVKYDKYDYLVNLFDNETWNKATYKVYKVELETTDDAIKTASEFKEKAVYTYDYKNSSIYTIGHTFTVYPMYKNVGSYPYYCNGPMGRLSFVANSKRRIRVFNTYGDFQNYTLGQRSVYYTSKYYEYVPDDLTVSIDDLKNTVDNLQNALDDLIEKITIYMDESEIEELLRLILEALRNQQSSGGGGGSGGGDVTVNVDMSTTNNWLSKIYEKISQIYKKMNSAVEDAENTALSKIQESLDEIIVQLKKIKRWTAVDTVIDGVDAIGDWLDLIRDVISDADEGAESAVTAVADTLNESAGMIRTKFPFSIPWDILFFISVLAAEPQVPYFEIPMDIELEWLDINMHYDFVIDFSQFQWLSDVSRLILSMTYAVGLLKFTMNIALLKKEE